MDEILIKAKLSRLRIAPRKVRLVADLVRGKSAEEARHILRFTTKAAAKSISKLLDSGIANARHNFKIEAINLKIKSILVNEGPPLKRFRPESKGRVAAIQKKTSHINLVLSPIELEKAEEKSDSKIVKKVSQNKTKKG